MHGLSPLFLQQKPVWVSRKALRSVDNVINGSQGFRLAAGSMYLLKFRPTITCTTHQGYRSVDGKAVTVVLVTGMDISSLRVPVC